MPHFQTPFMSFVGSMFRFPMIPPSVNMSSVLDWVMARQGPGKSLFVGGRPSAKGRRHQRKPLCQAEIRWILHLTYHLHHLVSFLHIRWWKSGTRCQCCSRSVSESWCFSAMVVVTCKSVPLHRRQYSWNKELYGRESRCSGRSKGKQTWHAKSQVYPNV